MLKKQDNQLNDNNKTLELVKYFEKLLESKNCKSKYSALSCDEVFAINEIDESIKISNDLIMFLSRKNIDNTLHMSFIRELSSYISYAHRINRDIRNNNLLSEKEVLLSFLSCMNLFSILIEAIRETMKQAESHSYCFKDENMILEKWEKNDH
ncbi:hypothetical protein P8822_00215 [Bacillus sonorensis]|uniref:hypothetical protein n=1 Tax=Bacillus subtilis group TaxID=653685 RepID=UPI001FD6AAAC|nr:MULTISPECIES: hypothetical protein [Bacillus subtilis group]MCJ8223697.1 hypothetical protein [Bacillus paralicheniformis]MEC0526238.1 hypothetical protein [Bacillus sonorensis]